MSLIGKQHITDYIPQRPPIVMVSSLEHISDDGKECETSLEVSEDNIFIENGVLNESGIVEHMAQSAALKAGYFFKSKEEPIPIGYIGKITSLNVLNLPPVNGVIRSIIKENMQFGAATIVDVQTFQGETLIAEAQLNIYTQE